MATQLGLIVVCRLTKNIMDVGKEIGKRSTSLIMDTGESTLKNSKKKVELFSFQERKS